VAKNIIIRPATKNKTKQTPSKNLYTVGSVERDK
jgi:hypothetical protein